MCDSLTLQTDLFWGTTLVRDFQPYHTIPSTVQQAVCASWSPYGLDDDNRELHGSVLLLPFVIVDRLSN